MITSVPSGIMSQDSLLHPADITFTILYNNISMNDSFTGDHGFSCLIEIKEDSYLFDAGRIEEYLAHNSEQLNVDLSKVRFIFISHLHGDHIGGLPGIIGQVNRPVLYLPYSFPETQIATGNDYSTRKLERVGPFVSEMIRIKEPTWIGTHFYSTGMMENRFFEQALVLNTSKGLIILAGCSHPGIVEMVQRAKTIANREVYFIMGGFHLMAADREEIKRTAHELRNMTRYIAPCHCTGDQGIQIFREVFGEDFIEVKAGLKFHLKEGGIK
ncbi:MAG: MBL fold metallo-hydrolase [Bacteroidales bacterium]|nr:MBL fold metallo-hydrolase [Bacteroidales bacterium]